MDAGVDRDTLDMVLSTLRDFGRDLLPDSYLLELDTRDEFPEDLVRTMLADLGVTLLFIPEEYGGLGASSFDVYRVCEQLARIDVGVATGVFATFLGSDPIVFGATEEQKAHWMTLIAEKSLLMAYGATEPEAGSDLAALRTTAKRVMDGDEITGYLLNGNKQWISNGGFADLYTILALAPEGPTWFIVDCDTEGFERGRPEDKHGIRASNTAALSLQDVYVGADRLVGEAEGLGLAQAQEVFGYTRLMVAAFGLGAGWEALDRAIPYSEGRVQGGAPLSEKQGYTHKLIVPNVVHLEAARAYIEETAMRLDAGEGQLNTEGAIAKLMGSVAGNQAADDAIQALGGYGYTKEYLVEKIARDVRITTIYEGTSEILEMTIARDRWQEHLKSRGAFFHDQGTDLLELARTAEDSGADTAALAAHGLAEVMEFARTHRLTRNQHVLFRLGELVTYVECAGALARRSAAAASGELPDKTDRRFTAGTLAAIARVFAREAAAKVAHDGNRWVLGAAAPGAIDTAALDAAVGTKAIQHAQTGLIADMDAIADELYNRKP